MTEISSYLTALLIMLIGLWPVLLPAACGAFRAVANRQATDELPVGSNRRAYAAA
jgi:hypothetical protein